MNNTESSKGLITIESYGGVGGLVTGSNHKISVRDNNILVDKGLFQGKDEILNKEGKQRNTESISDIARGTSSIVVSHTHIDHTGLIPEFLEMVLHQQFMPPKKRPLLWM